MNCFCYDTVLRCYFHLADMMHTMQPANDNQVDPCTKMAYCCTQVTVQDPRLCVQSPAEDCSSVLRVTLCLWSRKVTEYQIKNPDKHMMMYVNRFLGNAAASLLHCTI